MSDVAIPIQTDQDDDESSTRRSQPVIASDQLLRRAQQRVPQAVPIEDKRLSFQGGKIIGPPEEAPPAIDLAGSASQRAAVSAIPAPRSAVPVPVLPSGKPYPIGRHAAIPGYENPTTNDEQPFGQVTPPHEVGIAELASKAENIHNPLLRALAKTGAVAARVGDTAGTILAPRITEAIPGTTVNQAVKIGAARNEENRQAKLASEKAQTAEAAERVPFMKSEEEKNQAEADRQSKEAWNPILGADKTVVGFHNSTTGELVGPNSRNATPEMKDIMASAKPAAPKPDSATQNKENFQHAIGVLRGEGLLGAGDVTDYKKIAGAIQNSKQLSNDEKNAAVGYLGANPTPGTNVQVHVQEAAGSQDVKQKGGYYALNGKIVRGDRLTEDQRANAVPVKDPEKAESSIRTTNSTLNTFGRYKADFDRAKLSDADTRALQVLTDPARLAPSFLEKETAGVLDSLFGEPLTGYSSKAMSGIMTKDQYDKLSPSAQKLLVGYYNSIIANFADMKQRLGGIGRNESMIQAEIHTIPLPYIGKPAADEAFARKLEDVASRNIYLGGTATSQPAARPAGGETEELTPPSEAKPGMKWQHRSVDGKTEWRQVSSGR
jgi:hypothetical protein